VAKPIPPGRRCADRRRPGYALAFVAELNTAGVHVVDPPIAPLKDAFPVFTGHTAENDPP